MPGKLALCPVCEKPPKDSHEPVVPGPIDVRCQRCGTYQITADGIEALRAPTPFRWVLSGVLRQATELRRTKPTVTGEVVRSSLHESVAPTRVSERIDLLIQLAYRRSGKIGAQARIQLDEDYPAAFCKDGDEFVGLMDVAHGLEYLRILPSDAERTVQLDFYSAGYARLDETQRAVPGRGTQCFVAMWFDESLDDAYNKGFRVGIEQAGGKALRMKELEHNGKIDDRLIAEIRRSRMVVADFTGHRSGVYFEAGFADGLGIPVIWSCRKDELEKAHFDTRQYNHIDWTDPADLAKRLEARIRATVPLG